ncbi:MAG: divergent polysaccharide deacetylase family protein [Halioglobus sp.]
MCLPVFAETPQQPFTCSDTEAPTAQSHIVIILDDLGHNLARGREAVALPGSLTYAVIPFTAHGTELAEEVHAAGKEVMLHAPMSTLERAPLGKGGLTPQLSRQEFNDALVAALRDIPYARGVNNHMGSDLTRRRQQMAWLMRELRWQDLYFVDSRTNKETVAATVAAEFNVPHLSRHVFLDNERTQAAIAERFSVLLEKAAEEGLAVAIGHPYPETITFLRETLPGLAEAGVQLVPVSEALALAHNTRLADSGTVTGSETACCPAC